MRILTVLFCAIVLVSEVPTTSEAQMMVPMPPGRALAPQCVRPRPRSQTIPRTVSVTVPVPTAAPPICPAPPNIPCAPPWCVPSPTARTTRPAPVRVEVSVRPELCNQVKLAPVVYRDPGFLQPIICSALSLTGATLAAPFRFLETLIPLDSPTKRDGQDCRPRTAPPNCTASTPPPVTPRCGPPPCMGPPACAPGGPSVSPLPQQACPPACGPIIPPMMVAQREEPPCAPQSLFGGIINFPFRLIQQGRFLGDMGAASTDGGRQY